MYKAIPRSADWIRDSVLSVEPEQNLVITASGQQVSKILVAEQSRYYLITPCRWLWPALKTVVMVAVVKIVLLYVTMKVPAVYCYSQN